MKGTNTAIAPLGGLQQRQPADPASAYVLQNWTADPETEGFSTRLGYERYVPTSGINFAPFSALGAIDSLYCFNAGVSGNKYALLLESGGTLYFLYEAGGSTAASYTPSLEVIRSNRARPGTAVPGSQYCTINEQCIVTNGHDAPLIMQLWPLASYGEVDSVVLNEVVRSLGFNSSPPAPRVRGVTTIDAATPGTSQDVAGDTVSITWWTADKAKTYPGRFGIGYSGADKTNEYAYAVQFIYANGSEGPLSVATSVTWTIPTGDSSYRYMVALDIPTGPTGTVARRVYRTANMSADAATIDDPTLYFIAEIRNNVEEIYIDYSSTAGAPAPSRADSVVFPSSRARYCTVWQECLWLDGGSNAPQRIYWSNPQRPDQFSLTDYIDLGSDGGGIVGIHGYYRMLVILRERSVDIVTGDYQNGFQANTLATQIYCRSPRAVVIPNVGLAFVASDGIYVLTGGVEGGATLSVANMMEGLDPLIRSWTTDLIPRAVAAYCPLTREAHFYLPSNGKDKSNLGLVYSVDRKGWTTRSGFPVGDITQLPSGYLVFGHHTGIEAATQSSPVPQAGLFVISGRRALGTTVTGDVELPRLAPLSIYQSAWHSWGAPMSKKQVLYVTLFVAATGDKPLTLEWAKDLQPNWTSVNAYRMQPADQDDLPVYGTAKIGDAVWSSVGLISVRYAVAVESCSYFSWRIQTRDDVVLVGYDMEYVVKGTTIIEGKQ